MSVRFTMVFLLFQMVVRSMSDDQTSQSSHSAQDAPSSPYQQFGSNDSERQNNVRRLVDLFYDEMANNPAWSAIRNMHPADLSGSRDKLFFFLSGWLGGPDLYSPQFGHPRLRARHMPFPIASQERDQWLACMVHALRAMSFDDEFIQNLMLSFFRTADWMRNQPDPEGSARPLKIGIRGAGPHDE